MTTLVHCSSDEAAGAADGDDAGGGGPGDRDGSSTEDGGSKTNHPTEVAGTRFRPLYSETRFDDGAITRSYSRMFLDMKLNIPCSVRNAGGSAYACLPVTLAIAGRGFADAACTVPAAIAMSELSPSETHLNIGSPCEPKMVKLAGSQKGTTYQKDGAGTCHPFMTNAVFVPNPEVLPISTFGSFTREEDTTELPGERSGARLTLERSRFRGEDGSLQINAPRIVDRERDATGRIFRAGDEKLRFLTFSNELAGGAGVFADRACTDGAFALYESTPECQPDPRRGKDLLLQRTAASGCGTYSLVKPITEAPLSTHYSDWTGACTVGRPQEGIEVYRKEAVQEIPPSALAEITETFVSGSGRSTDGSKLGIRTRSISSPDGLELLSREPIPYLSKFDVACELASAGGETTPRCMPRVPIANQPGHEFFSDAACSLPLVTILVDRCLPLSPLYQDRRKEGRVFRRPSNPPLEFDAVYYRNNGACAVERNTKIFAFYPQAAHEEVPLTEFPQATTQKLE